MQTVKYCVYIMWHNWDVLSGEGGKHSVKSQFLAWSLCKSVGQSILHIQGEWKLHSWTNSGFVHHSTRKNYVNVGLLKWGCRVTASWCFKKCFKVSSLSFNAAIAGDRLLGSYFVPVGLFIMISYETCFHSCCKVWICRLGFIYGWCVTVLHHIIFLQCRNSWITCFWNNG